MPTRAGRLHPVRHGAAIATCLRRPADSHPEVVLRDAVAAAGLVLEPQVEFRLRDGTTIHPDLGDREHSFFVEIDHPEWHLGVADASDDDRRDRKVRLSGGWVERVWTDEIDPLRPGLVPELLAAHRRQRDAWHRARTASV